MAGHSVTTTAQILTAARNRVVSDRADVINSVRMLQGKIGKEGDDALRDLWFKAYMALAQCDAYLGLKLIEADAAMEDTAPPTCVLCGKPAVGTAAHKPVCQEHYDAYAAEGRQYLPLEKRLIYLELMRH